MRASRTQSSSRAAGYVAFAEHKGALKVGDKLYVDCYGKSLAFFNIGKKKLQEGMNILGAPSIARGSTSSRIPTMRRAA